MGKNERGKGPRPQVQRHEDRAGNTRYQHLVHTAAPVNHAEGQRRYSDDDGGTFSIAGKKRRQKATENQFLYYRHKHEAGSEIDPAPELTGNLRHLSQGLIAWQPAHDCIAKMLQENTDQRPDEKHAAENNGRRPDQP